MINDQNILSERSICTAKQIQTAFFLTKDHEYKKAINQKNKKVELFQ